MKRSLVVTTFLVVGTGAVDMSAGSTANLEGSDTLLEFTNAILAACPGTSGRFVGGGSVDAQNAMIAGTQQVAPMSRFLDSGACAGASPTLSQGLVIGLDGVVVVGSISTIGGIACNGDPNTSCSASFEPSSGAAYDTSIVGADNVVYTFTGWRDVLRVLFAGFQHDNVGTGPTQWARRNCNSPVRQALAENYGAFFENKCDATAGEAEGDASFAPICSRVRHIFRRDDFSSSTETMVMLLGLPDIVNPETTVDGALQHTGASPFCNAVRPAFVYAPPRPTTIQGSDATWDPTSKIFAANGKETSVYRAPMQDNDPIRRLCAGTGVGSSAAEDVCSHSGDLGLVLPIVDVAEVSPRTNADRYNATPCGRAKITSVTPPDVYDAITQAKVICTRGLLCPNGDVCSNLGGCYAPADALGNPQCLSSKLTTPALTMSPLAMPIVNPRLPSVNDGRSYNQHLYGSGAGSYQVTNTATNLPVTGAYYRIHTTHSLAPTDAGAAPTCRRADTSDQIGCLVTASPCSWGYAGGGALVNNAGAAPVKVNRQSPLPACLDGHFLYPLARKLYLNSVPGFAAVDGEELQLAGCMTDDAQPNHNPATPAGLLTANLSAAGFLPLPPAINQGKPFCEDFDEASLCGTAANVDACKNPTTNFDQFPSFETICGDGQIDAYEDCDNGVANGAPPASCSSSCRLND